MYSKFFKAVERRRAQALAEKHGTPNATTTPSSNRVDTETENLTETIEKSLNISESEIAQSAAFGSNQSGYGNDLVLVPSVITKVGIESECTFEVPLGNRTEDTATETGIGRNPQRKSRVCFIKTSSQSVETKMYSCHSELGDSVASCVSNKFETVPSSLIKSTEISSQESKQQTESAKINLMHVKEMELNRWKSSEIQSEYKGDMENSSQESRRRTGGATMNMKELRKKLLDRMSKASLLLDGNERDEGTDSFSHKSEERIVSVKSNIMDIEEKPLGRISESPLIPGEDENNHDSKGTFEVIKPNVMDISKDIVDGMFKSPVSHPEDERGAEYVCSVFVDAEGSEIDAEKSFTCSWNEKVTNESDEHLVTSKPLSICKVTSGDMDILNNSPCQSKSLGARKKIVPYDLNRSKVVRRLELSPLAPTTNTNGGYQSLPLSPDSLSKKERRIFSKDLVKKGSELDQLTNKSKPSTIYDVSHPQKNAVSVLNEMIPNLKYDLKMSGPSHMPLIEARVDINGLEYLAYGNSKKAAKVNVAKRALSAIARSTRKISENAVAAFDSEVNPVTALNNICKGLQYQLVDKFGPPHLPTFRFKVEYDGKIYYGYGPSKQAAKADTASNVLKSFNRSISHSTAATVSAGANHAGATSKSAGATHPSATTTSAGAEYLTATARTDSRKLTTASTDAAEYATLSNANKNPFAILNKLFPNPKVSEILRDPNGNASFSITIDGRKFSEVGPNLKSAKNRAAIKALYEMTGFRPDDWESY